jgi:hypothetical protein
MATTKIPAEFLSTNAIQGTLIADNAITTVHIAQNAITSVQIPNNSIGTVQIALNTVTGVHIAQNSVTTVQLATNSVNTLNIADDQVTADKLAAAAVVTASIVDLNVTEAKIAANSITATKIPDGSITATQLGANSVTLAKMASLARGSILLGNSAADVSALAIGSNGYVLKSDGTDAAWAAVTSAAGTLSGDTLKSTVLASSLTSVGTLTSFRSTGIDDNADALAITIDSSENVGIGNASPQVKFVVGDGTNGTGLEVTPNESSGYVNMNSYDRGSSAWRNMNIGGDAITLNTGGSERVSISDTVVNITGILKENSIPTRSRSIAMAIVFG